MKLLSLLFLLTLSFNTWSQASMKRCTLLPITDGVGGAIANQVFIEVEKRIKAGRYCTYVSNADLLNIFSRYKNNLASHLKTPEVLKVVSDKLAVGSLIRVNIVNEVNGVEVEMQVHGANNESYFHERRSLPSDDIEEISIQIVKWINDYDKVIPYDALVLGVLGDQVTIDLPRDLVVKSGQEFIIKKLHQKKQHPLLKKIVEWDSEVIAQGVINSVSDTQALGEISHYRNNGRIAAGDWVKVLPYKEPKAVAIKDEKRIEPGKLGVLSAMLTANSVNTKNKTPKGGNSLSGPQFGIDLTAEAWVTRMYFAKLNFARSLGKLSRNSGDINKSLHLNVTQVKLLGGYKYLPLGYFYGPQIDFYGGYGSFTYDTENAYQEGYSFHRFSGLLLGVEGNIPVHNRYRFYAGFEVMGFGNFTGGANTYGDKKSVSSFELDFGVKYQQNPRMSFDAGLAFASRTGTFSSRYKEVLYRDNKLKIGASFTF